MAKTNPRRRYDPLFKLKVVYEYAMGWPMEALVNMYGIHPSLVNKWSKAVHGALSDKRVVGEGREPNQPRALKDRKKPD